MTVRGKCPNCGGEASKCSTVLRQRGLWFHHGSHILAGPERERELSSYIYCSTCGYQSQTAREFKP